MCTQQKYNEGANRASSNEQPVKMADATNAICSPVIPPHVLDLAPQLSASITLIQDPSAQVGTNVILNAISAAYELGRKMAMPDEPTLPSVFLQLAAVADSEQSSSRSEMELVVSALTQAANHSAYSEGERDTLLTMTNGLQMDTFDLISRLYKQTQIGITK